MIHDGYENKIMCLLRRDPTKTYTEGQLQLKLIGKNLELWFAGHNPFMVDANRHALTESLMKLVQKGELDKNGDGQEAIYSIKDHL